VVFQNYALYPHMTVAENMGLALKMHGIHKDERARRVLEAAKHLGIEEYFDRTNSNDGDRRWCSVGGIHGCSVWFGVTGHDHAIRNGNTPVSQRAVTAVSRSPPASGSAQVGESSRVKINILKTKAP
jgi:ABC-type glutathione transport system ATPase component